MSIVVTRVRGGSRDMLRKYKVLVDGKVVGRVGQGETLRHEAPAGEHTVQLKIDWATSRAYRIHLQPEGSAYFVCAPGGGDVLPAISVGREMYIDLRQTPGPVDAWDVPGPLRSQRPIGMAIAFFGGGALLIGGIVWGWTGVAQQAAALVAAVGFVVTLGAMVAYQIGKRRADKLRRDSYDA